MTELIGEHFEFEAEAFSPGDIQWAQRTNSIERLKTALSNPSIDFIEVDVSLSTEGEPIAAHPPITTSDLTIMELVERVSQTSVGLKLDFKDPLTVVPVLERLAEAPLAQPVLLNADVLNTNDARRAKIDPSWFLEVCDRYYSHGILSLGWRTSGKRGSTYSSDNVDEMIELCKELPAVTFPIRATMLPKSWSQVRRLTEGPDRTLTIWNTGPLSSNLKKWIKENTNPSNCFYAVDLT